MSLTSRPRPATFVATSIGALPLRKAAMASSRSLCLRLLWRTSTLALFRALFIFFARMSHSSGSFAKIRTLPGDRALAAYCVRRMVFKAPSLSASSLTITTFWSTSRFARKGSLIPTRTSTGPLRIQEAKSETSSAKVAENMAVCRRGVSTSTVMRRMGAARPSPSMWSASSRTRSRTFLTPNQCFSLSRKSLRRPTVATTHCGLSRSRPSCCFRRPSPP
mmetsp:Transcript_134481/g.417953  ORF Transcript_134481/g.417953 Transcript_134481/m.417953 type:complete len:220 (-) Transcript_134481:337-996(-)